MCFILVLGETPIILKYKHLGVILLKPDLNDIMVLQILLRIANLQKQRTLLSKGHQNNSYEYPQLYQSRFSPVCSNPFYQFELRTSLSKKNQ